MKAVGEKLQRAHLFHDALRDIRWIPHFAVHFNGLRLDHPSSPLIFRNTTSAGDLSLIHSGSVFRDVLERSWTVVPPLRALFTYTFNIAENLAILQTSDVPRYDIHTIHIGKAVQLIRRNRFYLLTMSNGTLHPEAAVPFLEGETIALDSTTFGPYLFIHGLNTMHSLWNWKTGDLLTVRCYLWLNHMDIALRLIQHPENPLPLLCRCFPRPRSSSHRRHDYHCRHDPARLSSSVHHIQRGNKSHEPSALRLWPAYAYLPGDPS